MKYFCFASSTFPWKSGRIWPKFTQALFNWSQFNSIWNCLCAKNKCSKCICYYVHLYLELTKICSSTFKTSIIWGLPPYLHSFAPWAHVLAQKKIIKCYSPNDVEHLLDDLFDQLWIHSMLTHHWMEGVQLPNDGVQSVGSFISDAGCSLPQPCGFHPWDTLDSLMLQHSWNCMGLTTL